MDSTMDTELAMELDISLMSTKVRWASESDLIPMTLVYKRTCSFPMVLLLIIGSYPTANHIFILEPGYYQVGEFGIRIEDIVQVVPAETASHDFSGRGALTFKTITMCPKQTKMVKKELMSAEQVSLLAFRYYQLAPIL